MKLITYMIVTLGFCLNAYSMDGSQNLESCSNGVREMSVYTVHDTSVYVRVTEDGKDLVSYPVRYYVDSKVKESPVVKILGYGVIHGDTPNVEAKIRTVSCGEGCESVRKASLSYYDFKDDRVIRLPEMTCI